MLLWLLLMLLIIVCLALVAVSVSYVVHVVVGFLVVSLCLHSYDYDCLFFAFVGPTSTHSDSLSC